MKEPLHVQRWRLVTLVGTSSYGERVCDASLSLSSLARRVRDFHVEFKERMVGERMKERLLEGKGTSEIWKLELELG